VHIATGAFLMVISFRAAAAATGALILGIVYAAVAAWGFVDGDAVVDLLATDTADNWLHAGLGAAGVLVGLVAGALGISARREHRRLERAVTEAGPAAPTAERPRRRRFPRRRPEDRVAEREPPRTAETGPRE
jgi:hypothetical protein